MLEGDVSESVPSQHLNVETPKSHQRVSVVLTVRGRRGRVGKVSGRIRRMAIHSSAG